MRLLSTTIFIFFMLMNGMVAQNNDCITAEVICNNNQISYNPSGPGFDDFSNPNNDPSCLLQNEHQSAWYYFEFTNDMPANSIIEFVIMPNAGNGEDYDFAIYGPNPVCSDLGSPIRCTYANYGCDYCPATGLGNGETVTTEDGLGTGFVAPMVVQPGQGYYLLVDNWLDSSSSGFDLDWGGSAAGFLNCDADPECNLSLTQSGPIEVCFAPTPFDLNVNIDGTQGAVSYEWTASNGGLPFLSATNVATPTVTIPNNVSGNYTYTLSVTDEACMKSIEVTVKVNPPVDLTIDGETVACEGETVSLSAVGNYASYQWSTGDVGSSISVSNTGSFTLQVTDSQNCTASETVSVAFNALPQPQITGDDNICFGDAASLDAGDGYAAYSWSNAQSTQKVDVSNPGEYSVTVTDENGCEGSDARNLAVMPLPVFQITGDEIICEGDHTTLLVDGNGLANYSWNTGDTTSSILVQGAGSFVVTVTDQNNCSSDESFDVALSNMQIEFTQADPLCFGDNNGVIRIDEVSGGKLPYQYSWDDAPFSSKNFISSLEPGNYNLHILDGADCEIEENFTILEGFDLIVDLGETRFLKLGDETDIHAEINVSESEMASILWYPTDWFDCLGCVDQHLLPLNSDIVYVEVEDERGCKATQELNIMVDKPRNVFVPNAFSPNDDGINDLLKIYTGDDVEKIISFVIFDRWGSTVYKLSDFQAEDSKAGWEGGLAKGLNTGTYVYSTEVLFIDGVTKRYSGEVHLLR